MNVRQAHRIVEQAVMLGMIAYRNLVEPSADKVKQREVWRWLKEEGFTRKDLDSWVEARMVHRHKDATKGINSTVWYRRSEIQKAIVAARMAETDVTG